MEDLIAVAQLQTVLTAWKNAALPVSIVLYGNVAVYGTITDDGSGAGQDSIVVSHANAETLVPKAAIAYLAKR